MKKWYVFCFVIFLFMIFFLKTTISTQLVFQENELDTTNANDFVIQKIDISNVFITTKNITSLLSENLWLSKVEYEIPKIYQSKFSGWNFEYSFQNQSSEKGIEDLENEISNQFYNLGYRKEAEKIYFYGIRLLSVEVFGKVSEIETFEKNLRKN